MRYKIAYLTSKIPHDRRSSSGVYYYQSRALQKYVGDVTFLGPVENIIILFFHKVSIAFERMLKLRFINSHTFWSSKIYGLIFTRKLNNRSFDFIFAEKGSAEIAFLRTKDPIIYSTDATFQLMHNYYPKYSQLMSFSARYAEFIEQKAIDKARIVICTSRWTADSVINHYKSDAEKVFVLPRGANIDSIPDKAIVENRRKTSILRLLFIGKDPKRKGFDKAYNAMTYIRDKGIKVSLTVVGVNSSDIVKDPNVVCVPYLNKNNPKERKLFDELMFQSDFLFMPVSAECQGIVFCESAAYGLPVITTDTGGVSDVVKNEINGYTLPVNTDYKEYAQKILDVYSDDKLYFKMVESSRKFYDERLNWDAWAISLKQILDNTFLNESSRSGMKN